MTRFTRTVEGIKQPLTIETSVPAEEVTLRAQGWKADDGGTSRPASAVVGSAPAKAPADKTAARKDREEQHQ